MEDDNEILDWGNEDDEHHETLRRPPFDSDQRDIGELDVEDSISLGDEDEDNQEFLSYRSEGANGHPHGVRDVTESQSRAPASQKSLTATSAKHESQHPSGETTHEKPSTPQKSNSAEDSPRRKQDSRDRASPQRSQHNPGRLTHALPPKPVTTKVPYLPPSHPSIVEATSMVISPRAGGRETKKANGVPSGISIQSTADELPQNWEYREARNGSGKYYYNKETHQSTWEKPVSSIPSASSNVESRNPRHRSSSTGRRHRSPSDSNPHQSQSTRSSRNPVHMPPDREMDAATKTAAPDANGLSYEDRHYRPGGESSSAVVENRAMERVPEVMNSRVSSQSRYDRMPSPPPSRRRARSPSPHESRASCLHEKEKEYQSSRHPARGQNAYTNDPQRDFETLQPDPGYAEHRWGRAPYSLDLPRSDRDSSRRRGRRQDGRPMVDEHPESMNRSSLRRRENSREPNRDPPYPSELRKDANQNPVFLSAPRRGSTPPLARDRDQYYEPMTREYRAPPEEDSRSTAPVSSRKDRSLRADRPAPMALGPAINIHPTDPDVPSNRPRDRDPGPSPSFTHPSRRVGERDYDRSLREQQPPERDQLPRRPIEYQPPANQVSEQSKRYYDREPLRIHDFDRSSLDHVGQPSHRKRAPLPPQATTFLTSSTASVYARDSPAHSSGAPIAPRRLRLSDTSGPESNVPLGPRRMVHGGEEPPPRSGPITGAEYDNDQGRNPPKQPDRGPNTYPTPQPLPPINTAMDIDDEGPLPTRGPSSPTTHRTIKNGSNQCQEDEMDPPNGSRWQSHSTTGAPSRPIALPASSILSGPETSRPSGRTSSTLAPPPLQLVDGGHSEARAFDRGRHAGAGRKDERNDTHSMPRSKSRGRPTEYMRPPAQPGSGTNSIPIGNRRPLTTSVPAGDAAASSVPPVVRYNPDARPPPSTLIDPAKAKELLPPGKESYERPSDLIIADTPQIRITSDAPIHNNLRPSHHSESSERQTVLLPAATAPSKSRKSRFDKAVVQFEPRSGAREASPNSDKGTRASQSDASDKRTTTPPPPSRETSMVTSLESFPSRLSDHGQQSDARSDSSRMVSSDTHTRPPATEQPLLDRFSKDIVYEDEQQSQHDRVPSPPLAAPRSSKPGNRSGNRWGNDVRGNPQNRALDQPQDHIHLHAVPDPSISLSRRLSDDKAGHRQHGSGGPLLGRDEKPRGEVELSFHNARLELVKGPEEGMTFQNRLERPQAQRRGTSLLDRLSTGNPRPHDSGVQQSLRDRIIPSKRDREDMMVDEGMGGVSFDGEDDTESKRARRKNGRARRSGGRRSGPS